MFSWSAFCDLAISAATHSPSWINGTDPFPISLPRDGACPLKPIKAHLRAESGILRIPFAIGARDINSRHSGWQTSHLLLYIEIEWMLDLCAVVMARAWQMPRCDVLSWIRVKQGCAVSLFGGFAYLSIRLGNKFLTFCFHFGGMLFD
ncbi:hypothetical protein, unlikely [Trypanosoma congolense IL3000]|uniref:Uncharacterized protein n=1 Tax=Trypanosoma congolense (strain IL3000) TaxID=1068625 RepID=F9WBK4_TRYCI|nr:hypothetical protein, unlikely [Trypanosoma congolense IL3000]